MNKLAERAAAEAAKLEKKFGYRAGATGGDTFRLNVVPTGILALDYALGTGGWPKGHPVEVFGPPDIGKSSIIGLGAIKSAQKEGNLCGIISLEPGFDPKWAEANGVDPDGVVVARPDDGESAFDMLYDWCTDDIVDFIVFDSIGAVISKSELAQEELKSKVGGQSKLITDGVKRILVPCWKNNKGLIFLNQVRDQMQSRIPGLVESPGGHALKHSAAIRVELKGSGKPIKAKEDGEDVVVGRTLVSIIKRNKLTVGSARRAEFDFYQMDTEDHSIGIDWQKDVIATGIRTGVIQKAGGWYSHPSFGEDRLNGKDKVAEFLEGNDKAVEGIRNEVIKVMLDKQREAEEDGTEGE